MDAVAPMNGGRLQVLDLRDTHEIGGPGKTILETHRAIDPRRFQVHVGVFLTRHEGGDSPFVSAAKAQHLPVHEIRGFNQYDPRVILRLVELVKTLGIDIVHAHEVKSDVLTCLAAMLHRVATVTTLHGWIGNGAKQRGLNALDKRVVRRFDRVIAVSGRIRDELYAAGVPQDKVRLVHNAIVVERYRRTGSRGFVTERIGRALPRPIVASIGRLSHEKGHLDLIEAVGLLATRGTIVSTVLAGDGPERAKLVARVEQLGLGDSVHFLGHIERPERVLEDTDLVVLPSHTEGLPNAALEALCMEIPVLATRVGGTPEVITEGETGRLVDAHSPRALADAIGAFVNDPLPWLRMASRGRDVVERQFNFAGRTRMIESIYTELAGRA